MLLACLVGRRVRCIRRCFGLLRYRISIGCRRLCRRLRRLRVGLGRLSFGLGRGCFGLCRRKYFERRLPPQTLGVELKRDSAWYGSPGQRTLKGRLRHRRRSGRTTRCYRGRLVGCRMLRFFVFEVPSALLERLLRLCLVEHRPESHATLSIPDAAQTRKGPIHVHLTQETLQLAQ